MCERKKESAIWKRGGEGRSTERKGGREGEAEGERDRETARRDYFEESGCERWMSCNSFLQEGRVREMGREVKRYREHSEDAMLNPSFAGYNLSCHIVDPLLC